MSNNQISQQIREGTSVFDARGETVGVVKEYNPQGSYLVVQQGWAFSQDAYIPLDLIGDTGASGIYLKLDKDALLQRSWDTPPASGGSAQSAATMSTSETSTGATSATSGAASTGATSEATTGVPVHEEKLVADKRQEEVGRVRLHRDVVEEQQSVNVPLQREQVTVERVPAQGQATDVGPDAFTEKDIDVPVKGEEPVVGKRTVETEEVRLRKQPVTEEQQVGGTVRKEHVTVEGEEGLPVNEADT
jgi:uncharacterized protein (TIGR02271 family)